MYTFLSGKLNDSSSSDHSAITRHGTTRLGYDFEWVTLAECDGVIIYIHLHVKQILIIWFGCIHF